MLTVGMYRGFARVARRIIGDCTAVQQGEQVLIVCDTRANPILVEALGAAAEEVGADVMTSILPWRRPLPHGYFSWENPPERLWRMIQDNDVVIHYRTETMEMMPALSTTERPRTRILYMAGDLDYTRPVILEQDIDEMIILGNKVIQALRSAHKIHVTTGRGTNIEAELRTPAETGYYKPGRATKPGAEDYWPCGLWGVLCEEETVNGVAVLDASLYPTGILTEPVQITWEKGKLVDVKGGWQATRWKSWLNSFKSPDIYRHAHIGGGLSKKAQVSGHDWEDLTIYGSFLVSGGNNLIHGGNHSGPCHFDAICMDATIDLDGSPICREGQYVI